MTDNNTKAGTIGGTLLSVFWNIQTVDIAKTVCLAVIGAVVSFVVSLMLKWVVRKIRERVQG